MQQHGISAVILAAGASARFGGSLKAMRELEGVSFLERMARTFRQGGVEDILAVTGHQAGECAALAGQLGIAVAHNADFGRGMFSSIQTGLKAAAREFTASRAFLLSPVDAPLVLPRSVEAIIAAWLAQEKGPHPERIIIPSLNGRTGHPVLIPATHLPGLLARPASGGHAAGQDPDAPMGLRGYYHELLNRSGPCRMENYINILRPLAESAAFEQPIIELPLPDSGLLSDLDTDADTSRAEAFLALTQQRSIPSVEEAWQLLRLSDLNAKKIRHSILVGRGSLRLGLRLIELGIQVDPLLLMGAGLLHDILRLESEHAVLGAELMQKFGWPKTAFVVGCHTSLPAPYFARMGIENRDTKFRSMEIPPEAQNDPALADELFYSTIAVYMADKYARRDHLSGIDLRFKDIRDWFRETPEAIAGIDEREEAVNKMEAWLSELTGSNLLELVSTPSGHPLEAALDIAVDGMY